MKLKRIRLQRYKKILSAEISLADVNVLVGGNNSGKSSILQGIHFSITVAATARQQGQTTFASDLLPYNPTPDFSVLRNGSPYLNQEGTGNSSLALFIDVSRDNGALDESSYTITLYKGRNHGNIGCNREGDHTRIGGEVTESENLYSIYVPGLAGIAQQEELRAKSIVRRGVASGDANLYLRNIIFYIKRAGKLATLNSYLSAIFSGVSVDVAFDENKDQRLNVFIRNGAAKHPLELSGTGLLQILQIYSYVTYFSPKLLLLDEPDSHLHPDNQAQMCQAIERISQATGCQIILCTHSRHVVEEFYGSANFVWLKDGLIQEQGPEIDKLPLLLDLGALDSFDKLRSGQVKLLVLTEDRERSFLSFLLEQNGFRMGEVLIYSYKTSSNLEGAVLFVDFLTEMAPTCKVMIHRDRDFMTNEEVEVIKRNIASSGAIPFITDGSDIESYLISDAHISHIVSVAVDEVRAWKADLATANHVELQMQFTRKRDDIKYKMYRDSRNSCPETMALLGASVPLTEENRKGKFMLKKVNGAMQSRFGRVINLKSPSPALSCQTLRDAAQAIWPTP